MIKAVLVVLALTGPSGNQIPFETTFDMPNMQACKKAVKDLKEQDRKISALCIPQADPKEEVKDFFNLFMDMIDQMQMRYPPEIG